MSDRLTIKSGDLGQVLRQAREALGLSGAAFCTEIAASGGPALKTPQLSHIENGTRGLRLEDWWELSAALAALDAPPDLVAALDAALPTMETDFSVNRSLRETTADIRTALEHLTRHRIPTVEQIDGNGPGRSGTDSAAFLATYLPIAQRVLSILGKSDIAAAQPDLRDRVQVRRIQPAEVRVRANQLFEVTVELHNSGPISWHRRMLLRLGPPVTSTISHTAPLIPVPDTPAGKACRIQIPGRAHFLPGSCVVTYAMIFPDGTPCLPGGFALPIISIGLPHRSLSRYLQKFPESCDLYPQNREL